MTGWAARRFWTEATAAPAGNGFTVQLDGRAVHTPARNPLILPTRALAETLAQEWQDQGETIRPEAMPLTRAANTAIDRVPLHRAAMVAEIAEWGATDLLCYRAEAPEALAERQRAGWDPLLAWAEAALKARLTVTTGMMPCAQPAQALEALQRAVAAQDDFALTALSDMVALSGSLILGLAALAGHQPPRTLWQLSRLDEDWQAGLWGIDDEAATEAGNRCAAFLTAHRFHRLSRPGAPG